MDRRRRRVRAVRAAGAGLLAGLYLTAAGCAQAPPISPALVFAYGRISGHLAEACGESPTLSAVACKDIKAADRIVKKALLAPPAQTGNLDPEDIAALIGIAIGAAK